jgi:uncharacterized protein YbbC (DUF1343 family)
MTKAEQIAQTIREVACDLAIDVRLAKCSDDQDTGNDMVACLIELSRAVTEMEYDEAKAIILDQDNPAQGQIVDALAAKGIYL